MNILEYKGLNTNGFEAKYQVIRNAIKNDDFFSAQVKKLKNASLYSARLDHRHSLLFKLLKHQSSTYALMLEIVQTNDCNNSRFLNGLKVVEEDMLPNEATVVEEVRYLNHNHVGVHFLNKVLSFDDQQLTVYQESLPLIIIGSAGSGKTMLALEKMKTLSGECLYVSLSSYLVNHSRNVYYSNGYQNTDQEITFLSLSEFIETIKVPIGNVADFSNFKLWYNRYQSNLSIDKLYEEFRGTLTGNNVDKPFLSKEDYFSLGVKQSLFLDNDKEKVYGLFNKYLEYIKAKELYDPNIIAYEYLNLVKPQYDCIIIDEIQDLTAIQIKLLLASLKANNTSSKFIFCGDSNQIVHPNFFSWSKIKSLLYKEASAATTEAVRDNENIIFVLTSNYRNSNNVTDIANNVLKIKQQQFGSIDKESNYLIESTANNAGEVYFLRTKAEADEVTNLNHVSRRSIKHAIIVLDESQKHEARKYFDTPLVFSIHEAKGLEYDNVVLFNIVSSAYERFEQISDGLTSDDLKKEIKYSRAKDKTDKSMEAYKFYINAFYVAITRAIKNVYVIEDNPKNNFLELLDLKQYGSKPVSNVESVSTLEEWQKEATKLQNQGKLEQAQSIRENILQEKKVPWQVLDEAGYQRLYSEVMSSWYESTKSEKLLLFEYALIYNRFDAINALRDHNLKAAQHIEDSRKIIVQKYYEQYFDKTSERVLNLVKQYGLEFRNHFNQTALMVASELDNASIVESLIDQGANINSINNNGITALQNFLSHIFLKPKSDELSTIKIYQFLANSISLKVDDKLIKLDPRTMEYFLYNSFVGTLVNGYLYSTEVNFRGFSVPDLMANMLSIPDAIIHPKRKQSKYISYILAKHEVGRQGDYNKKLFTRITQGFYVINPEIEVKINGEWKKLYEVINCSLEKEHQNFSTRWWLSSILKCLKMEQGRQFAEDTVQT